jgi:hypothetical protein
MRQGQSQGAGESLFTAGHLACNSLIPIRLGFRIAGQIGIVFIELYGEVVARTRIELVFPG